MVDRRNNLNTSNSNIDERIKQLEIDNNKLISDNMLLVEENNTLKQELGISNK